MFLLDSRSLDEPRRMGRLSKGNSCVRLVNTLTKSRVVWVKVAPAALAVCAYYPVRKYFWRARTVHGILADAMHAPGERDVASILFEILLGPFERLLFVEVRLHSVML